MKRKKRIRFESLKTFKNTTELPIKIQGTWHTIFTNNHPITLELGCGKGEYTIALAKKYKEKNFIGVDIQGERIWSGATEAKKDKLTNVHFLRVYIDHIDTYFIKNEIEEIWITFPDPHPKERKSKKRLTSPLFLERYKHILKENGSVHLKTDNHDLFIYTLDVIKKTKGTIKNIQNPIDEQNLQEDSLLHIETTYEKIYKKQGKPIYYVEWSL